VASRQQQTHLGTPGASALLKAQRLRERRQSLEANRATFVRFAATLFPPETDRRLRREERNWTTGAEGEQNLASYLARSCPRVPMLHDRQSPGGRGNIDHIAVAPSGIYVIDCKRYKGKIEIAQPVFGKATLKINGRDQTKLIDGLDRQVGQVRSAVADFAPEVSVIGCLCFVAPKGFLADAGLPVVRTLTFNGYPLYYPRRLARRLNRPGPLPQEHASSLQARLAEQLPPAPHA
jgi:Nuclease-related domain